MGILIDSEDFTGKHAIAQNSFTSIDDYITRYEKEYLISLLGAELYDLFVADLTAQVPGSAIYLSLYNVKHSDYGGQVIYSRGMKEMLLGFVYFEYVREEKFRPTISGIRTNASEISREVGFDEFNLNARHNEAVSTFEAIQWYIDQNRSDYPTYNGQCKRRAHWAL